MVSIPLWLAFFTQQCFWDSSRFLCDSVVCSFYWWVICQCMNILHYLFSDRRSFGLFPVNICFAKSCCGHVSFWGLGGDKYLWLRLLACRVGPLFPFIRNCWAVLRSCAALHTGHDWGSPFCFATVGRDQSFSCSHSTGCEAIAHGFSSRFSDD